MCFVSLLHAQTYNIIILLVYLLVLLRHGNTKNLKTVPIHYKVVKEKTRTHFTHHLPKLKNNNNCHCTICIHSLSHTHTPIISIIYI